MTTTPPEAPTGPDAGEGPRVTRDEIRDLGRLRRSASDRKVAGVAGGLARHLDVDPLILRVAFVVLTFFGGAGLLLYGACWALVPDEETGEAAVTLDDRSRTIALMVVGVLAVLALVGDSWGVFWFPWPVAVIAVVALLVLTRKDRDRPPGAGGTPYVPGHDVPAGHAPPPTYAGEAGPTATGPTTGQVTGPVTAPTWQDGTWQAGPTGPGPVAPRPAAPRDPRRRGPILFWFTLALITFALGLLGVADVAGLDVTDSAYPALAVGIIAVMLLVGSVYGRPGGLIALGLVASVGLAGATAADTWEGDRIAHSPATADRVESFYEFGAGELVLDLTELTDPENLDDRTIRLDGGIGRIEVIVPDGVDVTVDAQVGGPGNIWLFGEESGGISLGRGGSFDNGDVADLTIDVELGVGEIHVDQE